MHRRALIVVGALALGACRPTITCADGTAPWGAGTREPGPDAGSWRMDHQTFGPVYFASGTTLGDFPATDERHCGEDGGCPCSRVSQLQLEECVTTVGCIDASRLRCPAGSRLGAMLEFPGTFFCINTPSP